MVGEGPRPREPPTNWPGPEAYFRHPPKPINQRALGSSWAPTASEALVNDLKAKGLIRPANGFVGFLVAGHHGRPHPAVIDPGGQHFLAARWTATTHPSPSGVGPSSDRSPRYPLRSPIRFLIFDAHYRCPLLPPPASAPGLVWLSTGFSVPIPSGHCKAAVGTTGRRRIRTPTPRVALQRHLGVGADGVVGPITVRALQARVGASQGRDMGPGDHSRRFK